MKTLFTIAVALLFAASLHATEVINAGKGGNNTRHLLARVDAVLAEAKPDLVILMVGTNDALNSKAMVPVEEYRKNITTLIEKFRTAGAEVTLMTILPCHTPYLFERHGSDAYTEESPEQRIDVINNVIRDISEKENLPLIDTHRIFTAIGTPGESPESLLRNEANSNSRDGVHPTRDGYALIATAVFQAIQSRETPPARILCFGDSITYGAGMEGAGTASGDTYPGMLSRLLKVARR